MTAVTLALTIASIIVLTGLAWLLRRAALPRLCPLCAGVAATWMGLLALSWTGTELDPRLPALLLGGSVVGLAAVGEKVVAGWAPGAVLAWKTGFVALGFAAAYALLLQAWVFAGLGVAVLAFLLGLPLLVNSSASAVPRTGERARLVAALKNCC